MQKLAEICIRRPVFAAMLILALVVVGATSYLRLGVDRFPSVDLPTVSIRTQLPGASAEEVETEISKRIEEAVNSVAGIDELKSISAPGVSNVIVTFTLDRDIDTAAQDVRDRVGTVLRNLPKDATAPLISKFDNDSQPVLTVALAGDRPLRELTELADKVVKVRLERSGGVGEVRIVGGLERAINVWIEADRLAAFQIPITAVRDAIARQNADASGGNVTRGDREETLRTIGQLDDPRAFEDLVVSSIGGASVRVRDIGRAEDGTKEQRSTARLNGIPTVVLEVRRQSGANTVAVIEGVKRTVDAAVRELPAGVGLTVIQDQSRYIHAALHEITVHLVLGSILASLVVFAFMRSWRTTVIAAVAIPASVVSTFGMMWALDFTLNSVTMLALVLMVGIVIDDAIVVLENIFRFVEEKGMPPFEAARAATADIGMAVMATTFSLVVIFIPVSFMSSISGRFLYQFGITAAVAVLVSLLVSFTLTPMMSARLLGAGAAEPRDPAGAPRSRGGFYRWVDAGYARALAFAMRHRGAVALLALCVMLSAVPLYMVIRQDYLPANADEGEFNVGVSAPQGTSLARMDAIMRAIGDEVRSVPGVRLVLATAGGGFIGGVSEGRAYVGLLPHEERVFSVARLCRGIVRGDPLAAFRGNRSQREVMQEVRGRLRKHRDLRIAVRNPTGFNIGGGNADIDFVFRGPELQALSTYAESLRDRAESLGLVDADTSVKLDKPELRVVVDRARAADLRVDPERIGTAVRLMVGGEEEVSSFRDSALNEDYDVQLRLREEDRADPGTIGRLYVAREGGGLAQVASVARIERVPSASRIDRLDRQREIRLRATIAPGFALADRLAALRAAAAGMNLPPGYTTQVSGRGRELERTFVEFIWAFALSVVFMYMILASQFENLVHPGTILLSIPICVPFALVSILLAGHTLNLYSTLGILVLFGVVKKNAILQIDHMNSLRAAGMDRATAILQGNRDRLRPILMTSLTFVAGMLPLALGTGPGSEERRVIAVVVIGGQTLSLLLTLLATPVFYSLLDDLVLALGRWRSGARRPPRTRRRDPREAVATIGSRRRAWGDAAGAASKAAGPHDGPVAGAARACPVAFRVGAGESPVSFTPAVVPPPNPDRPAWWLMFHGDRLLVENGGGAVAIPRTTDPAERLPRPVRTQYLGELDGAPCFSGELASPAAPDGMEFRPLRGLLGALPDALFSLAGRAFQVMDWDRSQQYCGRCGGRTEPLARERAKACPRCGIHYFPRVTPAVIVAVVRDGRILLARAHRFPAAMYSVLAGFVEPGETFEECVHREVREETGIEVGALRYFGSQPWPFPNSLMVAFTAEYAGGDIVLEDGEIADAGWFGPAAVSGMRIPVRETIARRLIDWFLESHDASARQEPGGERPERPAGGRE